jgi:hypothetical protein
LGDDKAQAAAAPEPDEQTISTETDLFIGQIDGLADTLPYAVRSVQSARLSASSEYSEFLARECSEVEGSNPRQYTIPAGGFFKYRRLMGRWEKADLAVQLVPRTFLVSLVSQFDAFLGRLIKRLFMLKPDALDSSESTMTLSELTEFGSIENARDYVIEKEIENALRKSHSEQFDWLQNKFGLKLREDLPVWPTFIEVTERRNLFVHSNGLVSRQYLAACRKQGCQIEPTTSPGKMLGVNRTYFEGAHDCLFEIGVKLAQVLWRKVEPRDIDAADQSLLCVGYDLIEQKRYRLARCILDFSTETLKRHGKEEIRLSMVVNRAQAYKWSGDNDAARKIIDAIDWSATAFKFQLAHAVLLGNFHMAIEIMTKIGDGDEALTPMAYREWPLFQEIRKTPQFSQKFEEIFKEPFDTVTVGSTQKTHDESAVN